MKIAASRFLIFISISLLPVLAHGWGRKGHALVAEVAFHYLDDSTKARVSRDLGKISIEDAANWMDDMRSNDYYDFMKPWHYMNIEKGESYHIMPKDRNILVILNSAIHELNHRAGLKKENIQNDLYYLFHLMGDFHQPMHVGYGIDKGGNTIAVSFLHKTYSSNLHKVWDSEIIEAKNITLDDVLAQYQTFSPEQIKKNDTVDLTGWLNETRAYLDAAYDFQDHFIDQNYVDKNAVVIEKQLLLAGIRLAGVLREAYRDGAH